MPRRITRKKRNQRRRKQSRRHNLKQRKSIQQYGGAANPIQRVIYCFWTGTNPMSETRKQSVEFLIANSGCKVLLITPDNLHEHLLPEEPLHESYQYLSETHKADYLRTYFMHFKGGGYIDIKKFQGDWNKAFDDIDANESIVLNGYHEGGPYDVAGDETVKAKWRELPGNGLYIVRPRTEFTTKWYSRMIELLNTKLDELRKHPATNPAATPETSPGYPIRWIEMLGEIFHPVSAEYTDRILFTAPTLDFSGGYK